MTTGLSHPWNFGRREKGDGRNLGGTAGRRKSGGGVLGSLGVNCGRGTAGRCRNSAEERGKLNPDGRAGQEAFVIQFRGRVRGKQSRCRAGKARRIGKGHREVETEREVRG